VTAQPLLDFQIGWVLHSDEFLEHGSKVGRRLRLSYPVDLLAPRFGPVVEAGMTFGSVMSS
jgi:hypothetical protein